jgi:hypothetical protein
MERNVNDNKGDRSEVKKQTCPYGYIQILIRGQVCVNTMFFNIAKKQTCPIKS